MNVNVTAVQQPDGSVKCKIECDGQEANFLFSGGEVFVVIPEPAAAQS